MFNQEVKLYVVTLGPANGLVAVDARGPWLHLSNLP